MEERKSSAYLGNNARLYYYGTDVPRDLDRAEKWFRKASGAGFLAASEFLPHPYLERHLYPKFNDSPELFKEIHRGFSILQDAVQGIMHECKNFKAESVYHFTKWPAINSILPKEKLNNDTEPRNVLRMYHEDYMNDPNEGRRFIYLLKEPEFKKGLFKDVSQFLTETLKQHTSLTANDATYMTSFTQAADRLDLWRAYGNDADGFCIKIKCPENQFHQWTQATQINDNNEHITSINKSSYMPTLYEVIYDNDKTQKHLKALLAALKPVHELYNKPEYENFKEEIKRSVFFLLGEVVYLFKDGQYSSEKEVRAFTRLSLDAVSLDESEVGKLYATTEPILFGDDSEIMIGPKVENKRAVELSLKKRLKLHGFDKTKVTHSKVEYR